MGDKPQEVGQRLDRMPGLTLVMWGRCSLGETPPELSQWPAPRSGGQSPSQRRPLSSASQASLAGIPVDLRPREASRTSTSGAECQVPRGGVEAIQECLLPPT